MTVTTNPVTTRPTGAIPQAPVTAQERRSIVIISGVWLVFLVWTIIEFLNSTAPLPAQIAAWTALVIFPFIHLAGFLKPCPVPRLNRSVNTLAYSVALIVLGLIMAQSAPIAIINIVPYVMSQWIFNHRIFTGLIAVAATFVATVAVVLLGNFDDYGAWFIPSVGAPAMIMIFARLAIEMEAQQRERSEHLALTHQREELASTVHDVLGHSLTTVTVKVQLAQRLLETDVEAAKSELTDIETLARRSLSEIRATVTDLQHPDLAEQLDQAKNALTAAELTFHRPEALPRLSLVQQQVFAWVIREAVTNVIRHAEATTCIISNTAGDEQMTLRIDDDGTGIKDTDPKNHRGLAGLHRRVVSAGGSLDIIRLRSGTRLEIIL